MAVHQMVKRNESPSPLRVAQVAPLYESVPPRQYGGTERVVSYLTEELVEQGHSVTLFASGDSETSATLVKGSPHALRLAGNHAALAHHFTMFEEVYRRRHEFDVVHFHVDYLHFPSTRRERITNLTTLHGRLDIPHLVNLYREFAELPLTSISDAQRQPLAWAAWQSTIHHGLPDNLYRLDPAPDDYLAFIGRVSPEKRVDRAIEIAGRAGMQIRIAAKLDRADLPYFTQQIEPLLAQPHVEFVGEITQAEKQAFLGRARALLFPIDWPEPFGLVMIEALACGTPVIAFRNGSVGEVIDDGVTGFVCDDVDDAVRAIGRLPEIERSVCRREFERRFTVARMAREYVTTYRRLTDARGDHPNRGSFLHSRDQLAGR